jgi:hypothetical protein
MAHPDQEKIASAKTAFAKRYLDPSRGIYSVGIGREGDEFCLRVSGRESALKGMPSEFQGVKVLTRPGAPGVLAVAGR